MKTIRVFRPLAFVASIGHATILRQMLLASDAVMRKHALLYGVDESHNHIHSRHVLYYAKEIIRRKPHLRKSDILLSGLGSFLHDVIDPKYVPPSDSPRVLHDVFQTVLEPPFARNISSILGDILPWTSFSKTVRENRGRLCFRLPEAILEHPRLESYHIIRQADLLSSYNIKRTILYRHHKSNGTKTLPEIFIETEDLFTRRMWKLLDANPPVFVDDFVRDEFALALHNQSKQLFSGMACRTAGLRAWIDYFNMDPDECFESTLLELEEMYEAAPEG